MIKKADLKFIISILVTWKVWMLVSLAFAVAFVPLRLDFLGGGLEHYLRNPWFWAWSNFDGEHYLAIAQHGYGEGEQAFFPLYPVLMKILVWPFRTDLFFLQISGILISHLALFFSFIFLWKLVRLDFKRNVALLLFVLMLTFPTSFYFGSIYSTSLFLFFVSSAFYFARIRRWWLAGILGGLASATRVIGVLLFPAFIVEMWLQYKSSNKSKFNIKDNVLPLLLIPSGIFIYMAYLYSTTGDPLAFIHTLPMFGEQRSATPIPLPQVFWRYFKIFIDIPKNDPLFFTVFVEAVTAVIFLFISIFSFFRLRLSYATFLFLGYLLPTLSGSFSSLPRYVLPLFPGFLLVALWLDKRKKGTKIIFIGLLFLLLMTSTALFVRGYWIA